MVLIWKDNTSQSHKNVYTSFFLETQSFFCWQVTSHSWLMHALEIKCAKVQAAQWAELVTNRNMHCVVTIKENIEIILVMSSSGEDSRHTNSSANVNFPSNKPMIHVNLIAAKEVAYIVFMFSSVFFLSLAATLSSINCWPAWRAGSKERLGDKSKLYDSAITIWRYGCKT